MTLDNTNAPPDVVRLYNDALQHAIDKNQTKPEAQKYAMRQVQLAGWYRTSDGWKRVAPDVRDKVNVRQAVQQPDGRYFIPDVDVFYPNATKGAALPFDASDIAGMVKNTNRMIAAGSQRPGLTEGHPHPLQSITGKQLDTFGFAVNWKKHPSKSGWARCDLIDVSPDAIHRLRDRKLTGLSAGIVQDAGELNRRFGHVAMLGGTTQSLSQLPVTEIYSVSNQVCFSADGTVPPRGQAHSTSKETTMPMDATQAKDMADCYSALSAAHASFAAGEEGADAKLEEAEKKHKDCLAKYAAPEADPNPQADPEPEKEMEKEEAVASYSVGEITGEQFAADPVGAFAALQTSLAGVLKENAQLRTERAAAATKAKKDAGRATFATFCADLHEKGHIFDDAKANVMFDAAGDNEGMLKALSDMLKASPTKQETGPADLNSIFSADEIAKTVPDAPKKPEASSTGALNWSAEENKMADDVLEVIGMSK